MSDVCARAAAAFAKEKGLALVEVQTPTILSMLRKQLTDAKLALYLHNDAQDMQRTRTSRDRRRILAEADVICCNSEFVPGRFLAEVGASAGRVHVAAWKSLLIFAPL